MKHTNIEIKARCADHGKIRNILASRQADFQGIDHQIDTYFRVNSGRLKLREGNIENNLIYYQRTDHDGPKLSNVILHQTTPSSPLKPILTNACGILAVVDKQREIYFIGNIKFHIDTVAALGTFVEIEAIAEGDNANQEQLQKQCQEYLDLFGIAKSDLISTSYSDLILKGQIWDKK